MLNATPTLLLLSVNIILLAKRNERYLFHFFHLNTSQMNIFTVSSSPDPPILPSRYLHPIFTLPSPSHYPPIRSKKSQWISFSLRRSMTPLHLRHVVKPGEKSVARTTIGRFISSCFPFFSLSKGSDKVAFCFSVHCLYILMVKWIKWFLREASCNCCADLITGQVLN